MIMTEKAESAGANLLPWVEVISINMLSVTACANSNLRSMIPAFAGGETFISDRSSVGAMKTNARLGRVNRMTCVDSHYCTGVAETTYLTATWIQSQRAMQDRVGDNEGYLMPLRPSHLLVLDHHSRAAHCTPPGLQGPLSCGRGKSKTRGPSYLDETILQATKMIHDAIPCEKNAHHLLCVVKASSYKEVRCG